MHPRIARLHAGGVTWIMRNVMPSRVSCVVCFNSKDLNFKRTFQGYSRDAGRDGFARRLGREKIDTSLWRDGECQALPLYLGMGMRRRGC